MIVLAKPPGSLYLAKPGVPTLFLAGPIQGADDWQQDAEDMLEDAWPAERPLLVANPRQPKIYTGELAPAAYSDQVDWERVYLWHAVTRGVIMFWLAREFEHVCDRAYAQTTRFELGEHLGMRNLCPKINIVLGIEKGFSGARYIRKYVTRKGIQIYHNLGDTVRRAAREAAKAPWIGAGE